MMRRGARTSGRTGWIVPTVCLVAVLLAALAVRPAAAARTGLWELDRIESWAQGTFDGTGLTSEGRVVPTISTDDRDLPARLVWAASPVRDGHLVATSLPASVVRVGSDGKKHRLIETEDLGFTAMARVNGTVYAGATPSGRIYRYDARADTLQRVVTLADSYVWSLQPDRDGRGLYVATGPEGRLYHLEPDGSVETVARLPGHNVLSAALFRGRLYVGDDLGGVYRLGSDGALESVYGFNNGEVAALASDDRFLFVGVNLRQGNGTNQQKQKQASALASQLRQESLQKQAVASPETDTSRPAPRPRSSSIRLETIRQRAQMSSSSLFEGLSGTLVYRMDPPERMNIVYDDPEEIVHDLEAADGDLYVATGGKGRLYRVREDFTRVAYLKTDHKLVLSVGLRDGEPGWITTGEGGSLSIRRDGRPEDPRYTSPVMDAQLLARWGRLSVARSGEVRVRTRSGNTNTPDTHWSEWSSWQTTAEGSIASPPARFFQLQVALGGSASSVDRLEAAYRVPNQRPRISDLTIGDNPVVARLYRTTSAGNDGGTPGSNSGNAGGGSAGNLKQRQVRWKVVDPDGDPARVRLFYRAVGEQRWISFTGEDPLSEDHYDVDLRELADGRYELRLVASDRPFNDPGQGFTVEEVVGPLLVDNTPPTFEGWSVSGDRVSFRATDGTSRIVFAQYRVNGGEWNGLLPEDGLYDESEERFRFTPAGSPSEGDLLEVRMMDEGGNTASTRHTFR